MDDRKHEKASSVSGESININDNERRKSPHAISANSSPKIATSKVNQTENETPVEKRKRGRPRKGEKVAKQIITPPVTTTKGRGRRRKDAPRVEDTYRFAIEEEFSDGLDSENFLGSKEPKKYKKAEANKVDILSSTECFVSPFYKPKPSGNDIQSNIYMRRLDFWQSSA